MCNVHYLLGCQLQPSLTVILHIFFCNNTLSLCLFFIPMLNYSFFLFDGVNCVSYVAHWNPKSHRGVIQASMLTHTVSPCRVDVFFLSAPRSLWGCGRVLSSSATSNGLFSCELHSYLLLIRGITISNASHHKKEVGIGFIFASFVCVCLFRRSRNSGLLNALVSAVRQSVPG